jgi:hypothetical protein
MSVPEHTDEGDGEQTGGFSALPERERAAPPAGVTMPLDDIYYPELYKHREKLRQLARWDGRGLMLGAGSISLGASIGALLAGNEAAVVWLALGLGVGLLLAGMLIGRARLVSAFYLGVDFNQVLSVYEEKPAIKALREHYDAQVPPRPKSLRERLLRFFNF